MPESVQTMLTSMRLMVCCLGSALKGGQPGTTELLQQACASLLTARSAADEERELELAAEIDDLRLQVHTCLRMHELRKIVAQPQPTAVSPNLFDVIWSVCEQQSPPS